MQSTRKVVNLKHVRQAAQNNVHRTKPKILFVDDEERILNTMQALFRRQYDTMTTTDGNHALELLQQDHYQLLVSDQRMPIMTGVDLLREAKRVSPDTVRILLTGFSDLTAIIGSVNEGEVFRFLNKPWNTREFISTVDEAVKIGLELQEAANDSHPIQTQTADTDQNTSSTKPIRIATGVSPPQQAQSTNTQGGNVIVLRGEKSMLTSIHNMLPNCQVFAANSHEEAVDLMTTHEIGVIISNVDNDHEGALEFFSLLKREHPQVVSVLLANSGDSNTLIHLINNARVFRYMFKPVRERLMIRYINSAIEQYQKFKATPTLLKQQTVQDTLRNTDAPPVSAATTTDNNDNNKTPVAQNSSSILGKMRKIRSFFSRLVPG